MKEETDLIYERIQYLRDETDFIECIFDNLTNFGIVASDFDGNIIAFNEGAHQIFGYSPEEIIGKEQFQILFSDKSDDISLVDTFANELHQSGNYCFSNDMKRKSGESFPARAVFTLTRNKDGQAVGFIGIIEEDITERIAKKIAEKRVEELENEMKSFKELLFSEASPETVKMYDTGLLKDTVPDIFQDLVSKYSAILEKRFKTKVYVSDYDISEELRIYSVKLGLLKGTARDVIEIHNVTIGRISEHSPYQKTKVLITEGRFILIELMGYLAMFYRRHSSIPPILEDEK